MENPDELGLSKYGQAQNRLEGSGGQVGIGGERARLTVVVQEHVHAAVPDVIENGKRELAVHRHVLPETTHATAARIDARHRDDCETRHPVRVAIPSSAGAISTRNTNMHPCGSSIRRDRDRGSFRSSVSRSLQAGRRDPSFLIRNRTVCHSVVKKAILLNTRRAPA